MPTKTRTSTTRTKTMPTKAKAATPKTRSATPTAAKKMPVERKTQAKPSKHLTPDVVAERAYYIWENNGRPSGLEIEHWLQAESELRQHHGRA